MPFTQIYRYKIVKLGLTTDPSNRLRGCKQLEINSWDIPTLSADPNEMYELVREIRQAEIYMGSGVKEIQNCELELLTNMRRSVAASRNLRAGETINVDDITWVRPGNGLAPGSENLLIGKRTNKTIGAGSIITINDIVSE